MKNRLEQGKMKSLQTENITPSNSEKSPFFQKKSNRNFFNPISNKTFFLNGSSASRAIQSKLTVGQPGDKYEQEADAMADRVVQRLAAPIVANNKSNITNNPSIQRKCADCEEKNDEEYPKIEKGSGIQAKSNNGLPVTENSSPETITRKLGKGKSLNGNTQSRMEAAFGTGFSNVEIHHDSNAEDLSGKLGARAFTVGDHIAFAKGEYEPGTIAGEALIAHELAHVIQQNGGNGTNVQSKGNTNQTDLEKDADNAAAGAVINSWSRGKLSDGDSPKKIMPKLKSGLRLQRCPATQKKVVMPTKDPEDMKLIRRFRSTKYESRESQMLDAGKLLGEVGEWAENEKDKQSMPESVGVVGLAHKQMENATKALAILKANRSLYDVKGLRDVSAKLSEASKLARATKKYIGSDDREHQLLFRKGLIETGESLDHAEVALEKMRDSVDGYPLYLEIKKGRDMLDQVKEGKVVQDDGIDWFVDQNKSINAEILKIETKYTNRPAAIDRIAFLVQYFIAINSPGQAGDPSADERKKFKGKLAGSMSMDLNEVFGESSGLNFDLFIEFGNMLDKQLAIREAMAKAGLPDTMIPSQKDIGDYFKKLSKKPNAEVIKAYKDYAGAFFFHRIVTNIDDMRLTNVAEIFKRDTSITASRPLVCSGYAILGAHLFSQAGGKVEQFITGVRATDADILNNTIADGHALAQISRRGQRFWVSNDDIEFSREAGLSVLSNAGKMHTATGKTNAASVDNLKKALVAKIKALEKKKP